MKASIIKIIAGGVLATGFALPTSLYMEQRQVNEDLNRTYRLQIQEHEQTAMELLKRIEEMGVEIDGLNKSNKELQSKNSDLEGVRSIISNNLGCELQKGDVDILQKLVEAEAGGESMEGKIAVVNVVMNRVKSNKYPNNIRAVIYQKNQFQPVSTGVIYQKTPSAETKEAVRRALLGERVIGSDILNFWATWLDSGHEVWKHLTPVRTIGVHHFAKEWED